MKSLDDIHDNIQTFSAHAHSEEENIDKVLDICSALLGQLKALRYHVDNLNGSKGEFIARLGRLESVSHEPIALPLAEMQERIADLDHARDITNGTIKIHNEHLAMHGRDLLQLRGAVFDAVQSLPTLRDRIAIGALASLVDLGDDERITPQRLAAEAYEIADAMLAIRGDKPVFQPQKFIADYSRPHKFDYWKMSGLRHTQYRVCKCGFSEDSAIHLKENQDVNTIDGQPKSITIEFAEEEVGKGEQTHGYDLDGTKETPIEDSDGGTDPE